MRRTAVPLLFALVALHLSLSFTAGVGWNHHEEYLGDRYDCLSRSILQGQYADCAGITPTAYRLPGYPVALAGMFGAFDGSEAAARLLQSVLAACSVFVVVTFTQRLGGSAFVAGLGACVSWGMYYFASMLMTEGVFTLVLLLFVVTLTYRRYRTAGILLGIALLTRGTLLFLLPMIPFLIPRRYWLRFALPLLCIVGVWTARNAVVMRAFVPFSTGAGAVAWGANNPIEYANALGSWNNGPDLPYWNEIKDLPEVERDRAQTRLALDYVRSVPPALVAVNVVAKEMNQWGFFEEPTTKLPVLLFVAVAAGRCLLSLVSWRQRASTRRHFGAARGLEARWNR